MVIIHNKLDSLMNVSNMVIIHNKLDSLMISAIWL